MQTPRGHMISVTPFHGCSALRSIPSWHKGGGRSTTTRSYITSLHSVGPRHDCEYLETTHEVDAVEDLHFADLAAAGVGEIAVVVVGGERAQPRGVRRRVTDRVQHLHITDVVDVERLLQAHHQPLYKGREFIITGMSSFPGTPPTSKLRNSNAFSRHQ